MARLWNIALVIGAFALMTFGTFLTRGNVLSSVHAFTQTSVGPAYLAFLALVLLAGFGLVAWRLPELRTPASLTRLPSERRTPLVSHLITVEGCVGTGLRLPSRSALYRSGGMRRAAWAGRRVGLVRSMVMSGLVGHGRMSSHHASRTELRNRRLSGP